MTSTPPPIPLVDLKAQMERIRPEIDRAIADILDRCEFVFGGAVAEFERAFGAFCGVDHAIGVANGSDALHLACRALDIGPGDEVIVPAMTFASTALGVSLAGARPVLVDVRADDGLIDAEAIAAAVTAKTRAIIPVHLYGQCADMEAICALARTHDLRVIEDAAQAHGAELAGRRAGAFGDLACFSFYPGKNLGAYGDGGMIVTGDHVLAERVRSLRNMGSMIKYHHEEVGLNSRLDTLQAAILSVKLRHLDEWNSRRRRIALRYDEAFAGIAGIRMTRYGQGSVYHLYVLRVAERDQILAALHTAGIGAGIHYPFALHQLKAYAGLEHRSGAFSQAEDWARSCLSLPIYAELSDADVDRVADALISAVQS